MRIAYGVRSPIQFIFKRQFCEADLPRATCRVCDGSGVLIKSDAVVKRNASDFIKTERA